MNQTPHQERSEETFHTESVQEQLQNYALVEKIRKVLSNQTASLGLWQINQYLMAKEDQAKGGEGLVHSVTFDN